MQCIMSPQHRPAGTSMLLILPLRKHLISRVPSVTSPHATRLQEAYSCTKPVLLSMSSAVVASLGS